LGRGENNGKGGVGGEETWGGGKEPSDPRPCEGRGRRGKKPREKEGGAKGFVKLSVFFDYPRKGGKKNKKKRGKRKNTPPYKHPPSFLKRKAGGGKKKNARKERGGAPDGTRKGSK